MDDVANREYLLQRAEIVDQVAQLLPRQRGTTPTDCQLGGAWLLVFGSFEGLTL